jgi:hypothetical protein
MAGAADMAPHGRRLAGGHLAAVGGVGVFLDEDGIGARRHRCAGEDADRFAFSHRSGEPPAGGRHADDGQRRRRRRNVGGPHGVAVHR